MKSTPAKHNGLSDICVAIISAAYEIVKSSGCSSLSIRRIGQEASCSVPVIYRYFGNKSGILRALRNKGFALLSIRIISAKIKYSKPSEQLTEMFFAYWQFTIDEWPLYQLMFNDGFSLAGAPLLTGGSVAEQIVKETIREAYKCDNADERYVNQKFYTIWAALHGLTIINQKCGLTAKHRESILEEIRKMLLEPDRTSAA